MIIKYTIKMKDNQRFASFDLLRIIAMFMVLMLHALGHGGVLEHYRFASNGYILYWTIESFCYVAVNVFVLISGYFLVTANNKPSRLIKLVLQTEFFSLLSLAISVCYFHRELSLEELVLAVFPLTGGEYWFASVYAVLLILAPLYNRFILSLNRWQHKSVLIFLICIFCIIPSVFPWSKDQLADGYSILWFSVLYFFAAYIRLHNKKETNGKEWPAWKHFAAYAFLCGGVL